MLLNAGKIMLPSVVVIRCKECMSTLIYKVFREWKEPPVTSIVR